MVAPLKLVILSLFICSSSWALNIKNSQFHFRTGMLNGKYSGIFEGDFQVSSALDLEFEFFVANDGSVIFRLTQAMDNPDSRPFYTYAGSGFRKYWRSKGMSSTQAAEGVIIESIPKWRFYVGGDMGIAQVLVRSFGPNVQSVANMLDVGLNVGTIFQVSKKFGLEAHAGATYGYGISSTPTNGSTIRMLFGASYYF